jgi:DNA-binding winged helix-turn-helix (wHTH) protein/Tol biopolymer transport system component
MAGPQLQPRPSKLRFAAFEVDLDTRELFKHGSRIRIQEQPFEVLCMLLARPGQIVSREELRQRLWPDNTFVEYEDSLNTAVRKLRAVLSDSFDQPRYIETVARQGYRFIAPIAPVVPISLPGPEIAVVPGAKRSSMSLRRKVWWLPVVIAGLAVVMLLALPTPMPRLVRIVPVTDSGAVHPNQKLLTDGPRLYFSERTNGKWLPKWMPISGGPAVPIALPFFADLQDISPDGSELLVRELRGDGVGIETWSLSTTGGAPRPLSTSAVAAAAYTRDGRLVLYSQGSTVYACDRDGSNRRRIVGLPGTVFGIHMSPQADRLRFYVAQEPSEGVVLWESGSDGANLHRVIDDWPRPRSEFGGGWSPNGRWFTFSAPGETGTDVWLLGKPGWFRRRPVLARLTSGPMDFVRPIFSVDGKRIFVLGGTRRGELQRYDFTKREYTRFLGGISAEVIEFSPDREWLLYVSYPDGRLWRSRTNGGEAAPLTTPPMKAGRAYWSPDGSKIAFEGRPSRTGPWNTYVIPATGGTPEEVASETDHGGLTWRPDSKSLIVSNAQENSPARIVNLEDHSTAAVPGTEGAFEVSLSPSGRYLVAKMNNSLVVLDLITRHKKQLATGVSDMGYFNWSADDRYVYFNTFLGTAPAFYRMRIADGSTDRLMELTQFSAAGSWGAWSTLAPDGSLLLMRWLGGTDVYAIDWSER